jgi:hypothetical protein
VLADAHRSAAEDIEATITPLIGVSHAARMVIEGAWGAAFHWIAFGCQMKHGTHQESHARLGTFLRARGESATADRWERLDQLRQGGWYGTRTDLITVNTAYALMQEIRSWATS